MSPVGLGFPEGSPLLAVLCGLPLPVFCLFLSVFVCLFSTRSHCTWRPQGEARFVPPVTFDVLVHPSLACNVYFWFV